MKKKEWKKPELLIIKRDNPEENVLLQCPDISSCGENADATS